MKEDELKIALTKRREELKISYRDIQRQSGVGYNTVRRVFDNPWHCRIISVLSVLAVMKCELIFAVEDKIGDELEQNGPVVEQ